MIRFKDGYAVALLGASVSALASGAAMAAPTARLQIAALPATPERPIVEDRFCAIAGVDRNALGVAVYFTERRRVTQIVAADAAPIEHRFDPDLLPGAESSDADGAVMHLALGDRFSIRDAGKELCAGTVVRGDDGRLGVAMTASVLRAEKTETSTKLIRAQPVTATVREGASEKYVFAALWPEQVEQIPALKRRFDTDAATAERMLQKAVSELEPMNDKDRAPESHVPKLIEETEVAGDTAQLLSLLTYGYQFDAGAAHGLGGHRARLWDRKRNVEIASMTALFSDGMKALRPSYCAALDAAREARSGDWKASSGKKYGGIWDCPSYDQLALVAMGTPACPSPPL